MNSTQADKLSLPDILSKLGYEPVKTTKGGRELWYKSPFRNENDASFHTSFLGGKWIWNDFGDKGGTVLTFIMRYYDVNAKEGLAHLRRLTNSEYQQSLFSSSSAMKTPTPATTPTKEQETLSLVKISPLIVDSFRGRGLLHYLTEKRAIDTMLATKYLVEVVYRNNENDKEYFAAGMKNEAGGYEVRNPYHKSVLGQKDIIFIKGNRVGQAAVFEGFMDFLSALTFYQSADLARFQEIVQGDTVIMNSATGFYERTTEKLKAGDYRRISFYLDNDPTGRKVLNQFRAEFPGILEDASRIYQGHNDFNDFLVANKPTRTNNGEFFNR